jgi:4'-phosphopantetheinyl transferase
VMAETELWLVELDKAEAVLEGVEATTPRLSDDIRRRLGEMSNDALRRERRLAHIALRILLEARLGPGIRHAPFAVSAAGKPSLAAADVAFSLAHTRGLALIAIGDCEPLGVDIERMRPVRMPDARRAPIEREAVALAAGAALTGHHRDARFLNAWVRIEAAAKAHGLGVGPILERLRPRRAAPRDVPPPGADAMPAIVVHDLPVPEGVFAAAALAAGRASPLLRVLPEAAAAIAALLDAGQGGTRH